MFTLGGFTISWKATLHNTVALSTIETEYIAIIEAYMNAMWLGGLIGETSEDLHISIVFVIIRVLFF